MRKKFLKIFILILFISAHFLKVEAYDDGIEENDLIRYGFHLIVDGQTIEYHDEDSAIGIMFRKETIDPIGLYNRMLGMKIGQPKSFQVPPEEGFDSSDPEYGYLAGKTLYYNNVEVYSVEGVDENTDINNNNTNITAILLGIGGFISIVGLIYVFYYFYPKIFYKRCSNCKQKAAGKCKNCGEIYCNKCFSNGCYQCKSRTLVRFQ